MSRKSRLSQVLEVENRAEEDEAPPPGSKLAQRRSQGPAERQREEGLRAFDLRVAGVKPPDLGGVTFTVKPVQVLGRLVVVLLVGCTCGCLDCGRKEELDR